jgi:lauroyl/myristoyl acyltransferase
MLKNNEICLYVRKIDIEYAKKLIEREEKVVSAVGHQATAEVLSILLGTKIEANRVEIKLDLNDRMLVFQLRKRLSEGEVLKTRDEIEQVGYDLYAIAPVQCPGLGLWIWLG